jgi:hypothetical protein
MQEALVIYYGPFASRMSSKALVMRCVPFKKLRPSVQEVRGYARSGILQEADGTPFPISPQALGICQVLNFTEQIAKRFNRPCKWENNASAHLAMPIAES